MLTTTSPEAVSGQVAVRSARCRFCTTPLRHTFADLGMSPLANAYLRPEQLDQMEPFYPLRAWVCEQCLLVQVAEVESAAHLFSEYAYFSSYSDSWLAHAERYVIAMIERFGLTDKSRVVEVAANDGYLLQYFVERRVPVLGIEPAANVAKTAQDKGIPMVVRFFGTETARALAAEGVAADVMTANNVVAHVPDLNDFVAGFKILLRPQGVATFEFHHVWQLMQHNQCDTIYHEHYYYHSLSTFRRILAHSGLTVFDVEELPTHGGSLRVYAQHIETGAHSPTPRLKELLDREAAAGLTGLGPYVDFAKRVRDMKFKLLAFLLAAKAEGKTIAGYGAPAKGNTLLNYAGVRSDFIDYTVDRSPHKQGLYLPGTHIPIHAPEKIAETRPDYLLILPWNLREEVMAQMSHIREWGGRFLVLIPEVQVYE
jgi:hypothetical protein